MSDLVVIARLAELAYRSVAACDATADLLRDLADALEAAQRSESTARELLREAREWLCDPQMSTWPYMENGPFYADKDAWVVRIDAFLAGERK